MLHEHAFLLSENKKSGHYSAYPCKISSSSSDLHTKQKMGAQGGLKLEKESGQIFDVHFQFLFTYLYRKPFIGMFDAHVWVWSQTPAQFFGCLIAMFLQTLYSTIFIFRTPNKDQTVKQHLFCLFVQVP